MEFHKKVALSVVVAAQVLFAYSANNSFEQFAQAQSSAPEGLVTTVPSSSSQASELKSIELLAGEDPRLLLTLSAQVPFSLENAGPSEYALTLSGTKSSAEQGISVSVASGQSPIRSARITSARNSLQVHLLVESGVKLLAKLTPQGVVVKPVRSSSSDSEVDQLGDGESKDCDESNNMDPDQGSFILTPEELSARKFPTGIKSTDGSRVYSGRLFSLDLEDTDIDNALRIIAEVSQLNIIASDDVRGKVTLRLIDVPWDQALDVILGTNGLHQVTEGNIIRITPVDKLRAERAARAGRPSGPSLSELICDLLFVVIWDL